MAAVWRLIYWPTLPGRGDFVRLMFEECGIAYDDVCRREGSNRAVLELYQQPDKPTIFAPPIVQRGDFVLSQTAAILEYLGKEYGLCPEDGEAAARAMQLTLTAMDYLAEGHDAFHPLKKTGTYDSQKLEAEKFIEDFKKERLPKYLSYFERCLLSNGGGFFVGEKITFADIAVFHALRATQAQFGADEYSEELYPTLTTFHQHIASRPRIAAFLSSDRSIPFCGNSMM